MLVAFFGDTHGNLNAMYEYAAAWEQRTGFTLDLIVQVGDFGFWLTDETVDKMTAKHAFHRNRDRLERGEDVKNICGDYPDYVFGERVVPKKTLVIRGNHEDQEYLMSRERLHQEENPEDFFIKAIEMVPNMFYLPDGHVVEIDGVRFGGLGGNFSKKTFENWDYWDEARNKRVRYKEKRRLNHFTRDRWELLARSKMDVLLFHDAPQDMGLVGSGAVLNLPEDELTQKLYGSCGCPLLSELIDIVQPKVVYCGHWHQYRKRKFGKYDHITCTILNLTDDNPSEDCMEVVEL